ncbi:MAG: alpha/beta fold hydrolase [Alphaproteobacteria bacterium]
MTAFVLVHGAWHGGWCWRAVAGRLRAAGHDVFTPTLTGLGERVHLAGGPIDLSTHVTDIENVLLFEDLSEVRLIGHSYGGIVISGVAEQVAERIGHLVYLDAIVPVHGKRHIDLVPARPGGSFEQINKAGVEVSALPVGSMEFLGVTDPEKVAWLRTHLVPHPMGTLLAPSNLPADRAADLPRTFIYCTERQGKSFSQYAIAAREDPSWRYRELATGHDAMVTAPEELTDLLLEVA